VALACEQSARRTRCHQFTGDGSGGDLLPETHLGSFGHGVNTGSLNRVISNFNARTADTLTPAGQAFVKAGLFTTSQRTQLGAVVPGVALAPAGEVGLDNVIADDWIEYINSARCAVSYPPGSLNGTTYAERTNRYGRGSYGFSQGIPRAVQFGLGLDF
jgi:hypothetical protein